jgi:glycosyltransferase involved in cell wall biosynthesis
MAPRVTQALPVYNGAEFLEVAVESLLAQSYDDFELLIGDNASNDDTELICREFAARDPRVRYLRSEENRGIAWNWNRLVDAASGRYFRWAAHDDLIAPEYLARTTATLEAAPDDVVLCYPRTIDIDGAGNEIGIHHDNLDLREATPHQRLARLLRDMRFCNPLFGLIRIDALRSTRLHRPYGLADRVLLAELSLRGQFWELPEPLFYRRVFPGRSMERYTDPRDLDRLCDPTRRSLGLAYTRLLGAHLTAIARAPMPAQEKIRSYRTLFENWRHYRASTREIAAALRRCSVRSR